ncbi:argonaute-like protein [Sparassis latifolia]
MPPRAARGDRGGPPRGGPPRRGLPQGAAPPAGGGGLPDTSSHVTTIGVRRPAFGTSGRKISVWTNHFKVDIPESVIQHYDVISPSEKTLPARLNMELIAKLQNVVAPEIFTPRAVYDGRKNLFAVRQLPFGESGAREFDVYVGDPPSQAQQSKPKDGKDPAKGPKPYKIRLKWVASINPEVLARFLQGKQSHDNDVLTAITALNVVIRMEPTLKYPFNVRSFFTDAESQNIGGGITLWRGYFQSVRPAVGKMLINVDISTATMYRTGSLIDLCLEFFNRQGQDPNLLAPARGLPERQRVQLQRFVSGVRIVTRNPNNLSEVMTRSPRVVKRLSSAGANALTFTLRDTGTMSVEQYFKRTYNYDLKHPEVMCAEVGSGALIPLELCVVPKGQIMRKQVPPEKTKDVLGFATKRPQDRLDSIKRGLSVLSYGQSEYVRHFGMHVEPNATPLSLTARVLVAPALKYGGGSKYAVMQPKDGAWNMNGQRVYRPATVDRWAVVVYATKRQYTPDHAQGMIKDLISSIVAVGMGVNERDPLVFYENAQGNIADQLKAAGRACVQKNKQQPPNMLVVVLPEGATDVYTAVKHFGDVTQGIATQCLKANKCMRASPQYYANVCLKINVKLGGINTIPDPRSVSILTDPANPTIVMGADVIHPAPGADGRPSFTALVANVDSDSAKYVADCRVQTSRQELIEDLQEMSKRMLSMYMHYRRTTEKRDKNIAPRRIIFYRDGVSEGQFKQVLDKELPLLKAACQELKINPTITLVVVGKRHHVRFFPQNAADRDKTGNCPAGTVVDQEVVNPLEFDWYLQSHAGLLGTSRPAHYSVLYDENKFTPDGLQALSFALCHVYARSTRSVSIPAPVYYADIVCARAKNHYDPNGGLDLSESGTHTGDADRQLQAFKAGFKPLHKNMAFVMYFS